MPYISEATRFVLDAYPETANNAGELNYVLTKHVLTYIKHKGLNYQTLNDAIGALEGAKAELQRRLVAKYEAAKITLNGDIEAYEELENMVRNVK